MAYLNKVMLIGNIGNDPKFRMSQTSGIKYVSISIATTRRYRDNNGEQKEQTTWHNVVGWGKTADIMEQMGIRKGTALYIEGSIQNRTWTDQASGQKRYVNEINMDSFQVLTPRKSHEQQSNPYAVNAGYAQNDAPGPVTPSTEEDDLPF